MIDSYDRCISLSFQPARKVRGHLCLSSASCCISSTFFLILSGGFRGGTDLLRVDPLKREYSKLDVQGGTLQSRQLAQTIYCDGYLYIFGGISVWPRGGVHQPRETFCVAKILDDTGKCWEWVHRDMPIPDEVPALGYAPGAYLVCKGTKILLTSGLTIESLDTVCPCHVLAVSTYASGSFPPRQTHKARPQEES